MRCPSARGRNDRNAHPNTNTVASASCTRRAAYSLGSSEALRRTSPVATNHQATMFTTLMALRVTHQATTPADVSSIVEARRHMVGEAEAAGKKRSPNRASVSKVTELSLGCVRGPWGFG